MWKVMGKKKYLGGMIQEEGQHHKNQRLLAKVCAKDWRNLGIFLFGQYKYLVFFI